MNELIEFATSWRSLLIAVAIFSLGPELVLRLAVLLYPPDHPRRRELVAELKIVPRRERPFWVAEQLVAIIFEAAPFRARTIRQRLSGRRNRHSGYLYYRESRWWPTTYTLRKERRRL